MSQPTWRPLKENLPVPGNLGEPWTLALDCAPAGKLLKIEVVVDPAANPPVPGTWTPLDFANPCTADGDHRQLVSSDGVTVTSATKGALIGRIGGSTADFTVDAATSPSRIFFAVGRACVLKVPDSPSGALFLGVNDKPVNMGGLTGTLVVNIFESI